jgi:hypothetical protein
MNTDLALKALGAAAAIALLAGCSGGSSVSPVAPPITPAVTGQSVQSAAEKSMALQNDLACAGTNLIQDGDLETPVLPSGGAQGFSVGSSLGPWTVIGPSGGSVALLSTTNSDGGYTFNAQGGVQSVDLTVEPNDHVGLQQTVNLEASHVYSLCFWVGNVKDPSGVLGTKSTDIVMINGQRVLAARNKRGTVGSGVVVWKQFKKKFSVPGGATTISFNNGDKPSDNYNGLDSIVLVP